MLEFFQNQFGKDHDLGKHTDFFAGCLVPGFTFALFKDFFNLDTERAREQIEWQNHQEMNQMDRLVSPIRSD